MTWDAGQYEIECLWFRREDLGGAEGVASLVRQLRNSQKDSLANWLWLEFHDRHQSMNFSGREATAMELQAFLDFLNEVVLQNGITLENLMTLVKMITKATQEAFSQTTRENQSQGVFLQKNSLARLELYRRVLDEFFTRVLESTNNAGEGKIPLSDEEHAKLLELAQVTADARQAGYQQFKLRRNQRRAFQTGTLIFIAVFVFFLAAALRDNYCDSRGEPFLLLAGISVWPTESLRLLAIMVSLIFAVRTYAAL